MTTPLISVFINTYNQEQYIEQAILSVVEQDFPATEMEILVVDDGSTDNTPRLVQKFAGRVRHLRKENGGQVSAYNAALTELRGDIVAFLDGDDWWAEGKLTAVAEAFAANPGIAAVGHGYYEVYGDEPPSEMFVADKTHLLDLSSPEAARLADAGLTLLGTSRLSVRRRVLDEVGPLPKDVVFFDAPVFTLALALGGALVLDRPLCYYRRHAQNLWAPAVMDVATQRRMLDRLGFMLSYTPPRLVEMGVPPETVDALVEGPRAEYERARLQLSPRPSRWDVYHAESNRFRALYEHPSPGYVLFQRVVCACALVLPPRRFYGLLGWYGRNNVKRFREMLGKSKPKVATSFFGRHAVAGGESNSRHADRVSS
jgi:glycosyltransferase involved in cell wall biosynthesis